MSIDMNTGNQYLWINLNPIGGIGYGTSHFIDKFGFVIDNIQFAGFTDSKMNEIKLIISVYNKE